MSANQESHPFNLDKLKALYFEWAKLDGSMDERAYTVRDTFDDLVRNSFPELVEEIEREDRFRSSKYWARVVQMEAVVAAADDLVTALWALEWAEDMVIGPKLRAFQEKRAGLREFAT